MDGMFPSPPPHEQQSRFIAWTPPPENHWKLNIAGKSLPSGRGGAAAVIRDDFGRFKCAAAEHVTNASDDKCELWALQLGFNLALSLGVDNIEIEGDSLLPFRVLNGLILPSKEIDQVCEQCQILFVQFQGYRLSYVHQNSNQAARLLADEAIYGEGLHQWLNNPPPNIELILRDDVIGRLVRN